MLEATKAVVDFLAGMTLDDFLSDLKTIYAVRAGFITLGEASGEVPEYLRDEHPEIPWRDIRQFRNFMVHVYFQVNPERLYETAMTDIPPLQEKLCKLLAELPRSEIE